jgi:transcriptional regulator with XRE-family HTH domain
MTGNELRRRRLEIGLSQEDLGSICGGMSQHNLSRLERYGEAELTPGMSARMRAGLAKARRQRTLKDKARGPG